MTKFYYKFDLTHISTHLPKINVVKSTLCFQNNVGKRGTEKKEDEEDDATERIP